VLHVEPVGAARARALLVVQPHLFFGDVGGLLERRHPAPAGVDRNDGRRKLHKSAVRRGSRDNGGAASRQHRPLRCASYPRRPGCFGFRRSRVPVRKVRIHLPPAESQQRSGAATVVQGGCGLLVGSATAGSLVRSTVIALLRGMLTGQTLFVWLWPRISQPSSTAARTSLREKLIKIGGRWSATAATSCSSWPRSRYRGRCSLRS
jgi:hypothetical protein